MTRFIRAALLVALAMPAAAQDGSLDKAADVMTKMRQALGGDTLDRVKALSLEGRFVREMGQRQMQGTIALTLQLPDRMHRLEDTEMMGGISLERTSALAGDAAWEDMQNRGGMGGGMQIVTRMGPPGQDLNPEQIEQARLRRFRNELNRYLLAFLGGAHLQPTYVAIAESPDGKADVLEVKNEAGQAVRLFVDQTTHLPLMLQYQEVRPRINMMGPGGPGGRRGGGAGAAGGAPTPPPGGQRPDPEEIRRRVESMPPPEPSTVSMYLADFKDVDGITLPHRLSQSVDGKTVEEWTVEKVRVNPQVKADLFEKK